jgi:hypothetical protein
MFYIPVVDVPFSHYSLTYGIALVLPSLARVLRVTLLVSRGFGTGVLTTTRVVAITGVLRAGFAIAA